VIADRAWARPELGINAAVGDPGLRRQLIRHTARTSLRSNRLSLGLIGIVVFLLRGADTGPWLGLWAVGALVYLVVFELGMRWCLARDRSDDWSPGTEVAFVVNFAISGFVWGSYALLPIPADRHPTEQAVVGGVAMMAIAANLVFGSATAPAFWAFHAAASIAAITGLLINGGRELALLVVFGSVASLPLRGELGRHVIGASELARRNAVLAEELRGQREAAELANLRLAELNVELSHRATRDPLTGVANRDLFYEHLTGALERREGDGLSLSVLYFDLDRFKQVNDTHGHPTGDELLRRVAARVSALMEGSDLLGRLGGDEFAVVTVTEGEAGALALAQRIRAAFAPPFTVGRRLLVVRASLGVATAADGVNARDLVHMADQALYRAKELGRDQVQAWTPELARS
jgi:diguanylate cyclase (GGDEF)-like protein